MSNENKSSAFSSFLVRLGQRPFSVVVPDVPEEFIELEISELEDKFNLPHEVANEKKEPEDEKSE